MRKEFKYSGNIIGLTLKLLILIKVGQIFVPLVTQSIGAMDNIDSYKNDERES